MIGFTLHFVGGPIDGRMIQWPEAPPEMRFPRSPMIDYSKRADTPIELPLDLRYVRRHGIVASEAVYDWVPD